MSSKTKVRITDDGVKGFFARVHDHARKLDRGEDLPFERTISFENANDMLRILSPERVRLLRAVKEKTTPVSSLAGALHRDVRAVSRDIFLLERFGLLQTRYESNPGHGRRRLVEASAQNYTLVANV